MRPNKTQNEKKDMGQTVCVRQQETNSEAGTERHEAEDKKGRNRPEETGT